MNHAEWERKVKNIEDRLKRLQGIERMGPVDLAEIEALIESLEILLK